MDSRQLNPVLPLDRNISIKPQNSLFSINDLDHLTTESDIDNEIQFLEYLKLTFTKNPISTHDYSKSVYEIDEQIARLETHRKELKLLKLIHK